VRGGDATEAAGGSVVEGKVGVDFFCLSAKKITIARPNVNMVKKIISRCFPFIDIVYISL
jgi:hypothetical protein